LQVNTRYELKGWIRGDDVPDTKPLFEEISNLRKQNEELSEQVTSLTKRFEQVDKEDSKQEEFKELIDILCKIEIETTQLNKQGETEAKKIPIYNFFTVCKDDLVTGVTNRIGSTSMHNLLYFNVCPKLQIHGLVVSEKVPSVQYRRFSLTKKGMDLLAYIDKLELLKGAEKDA
jgi:regulator of replication initiation timing